MPAIQIPEAFEFLFQPARYKVAHGGRGSGKSHSIAIALLILGYQNPLRIGCFREVQKSIKDSVKRLLDDKIREMGLGNFYQSTDTEIRGANGTVFLFAGLKGNADGIRSLEGLDIAWIEEAMSVSQSSLDTLIPTVRKAGSEIWVSYNPRFETDPIDQMFRGEAGPPPRSIVKQVNYNDNPFFPQELEEERVYLLKRDPGRYKHVWEGEYLRNSNAQVFKNWSVDEFVTPKEDVRFYFGADWGFAVDPTVLIRCFIDKRKMFVDREVYQIGCEIDRTPKLFDSIDPKFPGMARRWPIRADSARPETISYMRRHGYPNIVKSIKGKGSVEDGIEFLKSYDIVVHPRCRHTIDELMYYSYKVDPLTNEVLPQLADKKNHVIDALRYSIEELRRSARAGVGTYRMT